MHTAPSSTRIPRLTVFLSYRSVEARFADLLKQRLVRDFIGLVDVFLASDTTSIPAGASWHSRILEGLHQSGLHIIICSSFAVRCPWIHYEAGAAATRGTPIVPLCHSGLLPHQLPVPLSESEGGTITTADTLERLYHRIAGLIGSDMPPADFGQYARDFQSLERELQQLIDREASAFVESPGSESIRNPHVVCVTSEQFKELGYANQLEVVLGAFPKALEHEFVLTSAELEQTLMRERVDIVHIAAFVCPRGGDLYFSPVDLPLGAGVSGAEVDVMRPDVLIPLLQRSRTRLVVLGASASLVLGAQLLNVANVIAVRDMVSARSMAKWIEMFYKTLMTDSLAGAFELATRVSQAPMWLYAQQRELPSFKLDVEEAVTATA